MLNRSLYNKQYYIDNKERIKIYKKEQYQQKKEQYILYAKEYRKEHLNYTKEYHEKNKEKENQYSKEYYIKNRDKILDYCRKYNQIPERKKLHRIKYGGEYQRNYYNKNKEKLNLQRRKKRHEKGISERYRIGRPLGSSKLSLEEIKIRKKAENALYKERFRKGGKLTIQTIQEIYEENIKFYGTLTCYLCYIKIEFGNDSIDHKTPLSRGGTNIKKNLAIAHMSCNYKNIIEQKKNIEIY